MDYNLDGRSNFRSLFLIRISICLPVVCLSLNHPVFSGCDFLAIYAGIIVFSG